MKPGVVFGDDYAALVQNCKDKGYALPAVNVVSTNSINAVMEAAAKNRSDVIIQFSNSGAQFYAGKGMKDSFGAKVLGAVSAARHVQLLAEHYGICAILHTDHANMSLVPWVEALIEESRKNLKREGVPLYTSHMLDLSEEPIDENLDVCARVLKDMTPLGMSLEIELGVTGGEEDGVGSDVGDDFENPSLYTQPEDVLKAYDLLTPLGHFSVAASFGNVHGVYKPGNVKLRPEILKHSQELVAKERGTGANPLNFVFHGGSGSEKEKITEAVGYGVFKMNIDTDTQFAFSKAAGEYVNANQDAFKWQVHPETGQPYKKQYDPRVWLRKCEESMAARLDEAFKDLGAQGMSMADA
ncbi:class II fructose-bisphosphate aldolase [Kordiimonas gwangyangensis]|uniref:class II fructose-bisphosphate aldolase n=1 Tax=Kordiimonas gwangyangensis TaxID=288022 RepID=UPI00037ED6A3|nr:class II fructose-bisphosphate aldolase [Kordiimonas gwangyangensis]